MDLVPLVNGAGSLFEDTPSLWSGAAILLVVLFFMFSQFGKRVGHHLSDMIFANWRLALLGLTGVVLSIASGWTTWDGMRNFTKEPILSFLITFGIQGVMLIVAWLIGESFATGMQHRPRRKQGHASRFPALRALQPIASSAAGILLFSAIAILIYNSLRQPAILAGVSTAPWWHDWWESLLIAAPIVVLVTLLIVNAGSDVLEDYVQSMRVMVRSAVLWVMFLACMATSVFFSFDSLFSTIFPANERERAAELRAQNQVAGIVNDIASLTAARQLSEQESLFSTPGWQRYDANLSRLIIRAKGASSELQAFFEKKLREQQSEINRYQEDRSSAKSQQVSLAQRKEILNSEIARFKEQATQLAPEVERLKGLVFDKDREVVAKKAEAEAEAGGIGVTSKIGRGPKYREIRDQLYRLNEEKKNLELQLREFGGRLETARKGVARNETELTRIDGEIAKLRGRAEAASRIIVSRSQNVTATPTFDVSNGVAELVKHRDAFRREPTKQNLANVQAVCAGIIGAMREQPTLKERVQSISCDPGEASEAAQRVFALNAGVLALQKNCIGANKLPETGGADALFGFARGCVQDAGLPSSDTDALRQKINFIELNRDDKAHRFVVTTNAFQDGNKLAYLALAIAVAIDALVFMSGLFGANAVRSPLSDVPSHKGRTARQLEDVIENALLPDKFENAMHAIDAIQPIRGNPPDYLDAGWTHEARMSDAEPGSRQRVLKVLNAGATIGAVRSDENIDHRYYVRSELLEFLNQVAKNAFESDKGKVRLAELRKIVTVALQPYVSDHADIVLGHMHPISDKNGFTSEIYMTEVPSDDRPIVQRSLNAGATLDYVQRDQRKDERDRFYVHKEFYRTLATLSAEFPKQGRRLTYGRTQLAAPSRRPVDGGYLTEDSPKQITSDVGRDHAPAAAEAEGGASAEQQADLRQRFLVEMIQSLRIDANIYLGLVGPTFGQVLGMAQSFKEQRIVNSLLERNLRQRDKQAEERIDGAYNAIISRLAGPDASWQRQMLLDARNEITQNWPVLMLLPNGPYEILFDQMIENLEQASGEGQLDSERTLLLHNARAIRRAMASNLRDTPEAWLELGHDLAEAGEAETSDTGTASGNDPFTLEKAAG